MINSITTENGLVLTVGNTYIIDADFNNGGEIELVKIYGKLYCRVKDPDTNSEWDTMLYRLSACGK